MTEAGPTPLKPQDLLNEAAGVIPAESPTAGAEALLKGPASAIDQLTRTMKEAIESEDYERAARLRDQIREMREKQQDKPA